MDAAETDALALSDLLVEMTVADAQAAFARGVTAEALARAFLARIETYNPRYNALIFFNPNALDEARAIDARRASGEAWGRSRRAGRHQGHDGRRRAAEHGGLAFPLLEGRRHRPDPRHRRARGGADAGGGLRHPRQDQRAGAERHGQPRQRQLGRADPERHGAGPPARRIERGHRDGGGREPRGAGPRRGDRRVDPEPGLRAGSRRHQADLRPGAQCGGDPAGRQHPRRRGADRPLRARRRPHPGCPGGLHRRRSQDRGRHRPPSEGRLRLQAVRDRPAGKRLGLYGPGWRDRPLSAETTALYERAQGEIAARGATLVADPFAGSGFAAIGQPVPGLDHYDARGIESVLFDLQAYLHGSARTPPCGRSRSSPPPPRPRIPSPGAASSTG